MKSELTDTKHSVDERFKELTLMTRLLEEKEEQLTSLRMEVAGDSVGAAEKNHQPVKKKVLQVSLPFGKHTKKIRKEKKELDQIHRSGLFDAEWYLNSYPDVAKNEDSSHDPALHYLKLGAFEGRNPSPDFDSQWYLDTNPDVKDSGFNPLVHYISMGKEEGRQPLPC